MAFYELQQEYSDKINSNGELMFIGSHNIDNFNEHAKTHFEYLKEQELMPHHTLLDVGCGALRSGKHIIPYLDEQNYFGLDRMPELIEYGLNEVLEKNTVDNKKPNLSVNSDFNFGFVNKKINFVWCQSLMSHLDEGDIKLCLNNLKNVIDSETKIYFTYFCQQGRAREENKNVKSNSKLDIQYDSKVMEQIVNECGYQTIFNGTIGHPRGQWMYICKI